MTYACGEIQWTLGSHGSPSKRNVIRQRELLGGRARCYSPGGGSLLDLGRIARFLVVLAVLAEPIRAAEPHVVLTPFIIYTSFAKQPSDAVRSAIEQEIHSIIEPIGWKPEWLTLDDSHPPGSVSLAIIRFKGSCDVEDLTRYPAYQALVLGQTYTVDGAITPITDIYCSSIRAKLAEALAKTEPKSRDPVYGRAVARVVAHELYHILVREKHHASSGIAESHFTSKELVSDNFQFRAADVRKLRRNLVPVLLAAYGWVGQKGRQPGPRIFISSGCSGCHGLLGEGTVWGPRLRLAGKDWNRSRVPLQSPARSPHAGPRWLSASYIEAAFRAKAH